MPHATSSPYPAPCRHDSCIDPLGNFLFKSQTGHKRGLMGTRMNGNLITTKYQIQKQLYFAKVVPEISTIYRSVDVNEVADGRISSRITVGEHMQVMGRWVMPPACLIYMMKH
jgi:hypothetical protein